MQPSIYRWSFALRFLAVVALLSVINTLLFPWEMTLEWMQEGGVIENLTILMYYLALASLWLFPPPALRRLDVGAVSLLLLAAAARELDLHKALFGISILKTSFYRDYASGSQIVLALAILLPVFAAAIYLALRWSKTVALAVKTRNPAGFTVGTVFIFLVLLKIFDSAIGMIGAQLERPGEVWGYTTPAGLITMALEESLELALPLLIVVALIQARALQSERR